MTYAWPPELAGWTPELASGHAPALVDRAPPALGLAPPLTRTVERAPVVDRPLLVAAPLARYLFAKRVLDVLVASLLLILLLPVIAVIALVIVLDSGPSVFFTQERVGARRARGRGAGWVPHTFRIFKFRTMVADVDHASKHREFVQAFVAGELAADDADHVPFKMRADAEVTRVGRWLRATSLDELPQIVNVLAGSMSLVGPRPVPLYEVEAYEERHLARLAGVPGITGPWQVSGRGAVSFEEMVDMDVAYLRSQSLWLDLRLLLRTVPCALARKGAR